MGIVLMTTAPAGPSELSNPVVDPSVGTVYEPSSRAGEPFVTILSGGADTDEITIAFSGRADPIPLALCYTEETALQPLFDGGALAGSMVWDGRCSVSV